MPDIFPIRAHSGGGHIPVPTLKFHNYQTIKHVKSIFFCFLVYQLLGNRGARFEVPAITIVPSYTWDPTLFFMKGKADFSKPIIAKGTTDPRVEFSLPKWLVLGHITVQAQILIKFYRKNIEAVNCVKLSGAKLSGCQILRFLTLGAKMSGCQIVRF